MLGFGEKRLEVRINRLYDRFRPMASRYGYTFVRPAVAVDGCPNVVFLGNHSSGKSTFINYLLEGADVQDTGVAPTDDGFTVILHGTEEEDFYGPAALAVLPDEFKGLAALGPTFLQRLRVKVRNRPLLKNVTLIDSPGMVDAVQGGKNRDYDFISAVRQVAEIADLVLFMFDPEKPGTTGETVGALSQCLAGMEFKLRILMNKCDTFDSMYDFARAYGTLCWNLAHVLRTKDLPTIYTTYLPVHQPRSDARIELGDFDRHRGSVTSQIQQADRRRIDNLIAAISADFSRLSLQVNMITAVRRRLVGRRARHSLLSAFWVLAAGAATHLLLRWLVPVAEDASVWNILRLVRGSGTILAAVVAGVAMSRLCHRAYQKYRAGLLSDLDKVFEEEYTEALAPGGRDDLHQNWENVRPDVKQMVGRLDSRLPAFDGGSRRRLEQALTRTIPAIAESQAD